MYALGIASEISEEKWTDEVFSLMFNHQESRVQFYSETLRHLLNQAPTQKSHRKSKLDIIKQQSRDTAQPILWKDNHGLSFKIYPGHGLDERHSSDSEGIKPLSNQEDEKTISDSFQKLKSFFESAEFATHDISFQTQMFHLFQNVYAIIRHPQQRPVLKNLLRQTLNGNEITFSRAWDALLYLIRIYYGATTLVDLASRCKSFCSINFLPVPVQVVASTMKYNQRRKIPMETLLDLEVSPQSVEWINFFQNRKTITQYQNLLKAKRTVHAEVQMIYYLESNPDIYSGYKILTPYIGCSKKCCFFCDAFCIHHRKFLTRGTHETVFQRWGLPTDLDLPGDRQWLLPIKTQFTTFLESRLRDLVNEPFPLRQKDLMRQSSAALSTAKAVHREDLKHSERPSEM